MLPYRTGFVATTEVTTLNSKSKAKPTKWNVAITLPSTMSPPIVDVAFHYFLNVAVPDSHFNYVSGMLNKISSSKCFVSATRAVSLANLARERVDCQLMCSARGIHVKAIKELNAALKSNEVVENGTLIATLILGLFEVIVLNDGTSISGCLDGWISHTNGTMSLVKFRGKELLQTEFGRAIYFQTANTLRANCVQKFQRLPSNFTKLDKEMRSLLYDRDITIQWWPVVDRAIEMRARTQGKINFLYLF
jgi:Fungal specific transcription factor domain